MREKSSVAKVVIDEIAGFIHESYPNNESGIVYCFSRKECEQVCLLVFCVLVFISLTVIFFVSKFIAWLEIVSWLNYHVILFYVRLGDVWISIQL